MKPVFIGGLQRSGTSLMRGIVGSHPDLAVFQWDLPLWTHFFGKYLCRDLSNPRVRERLVRDVLSNEKVKNADVEFDERELVRRLESLGNGAFGAFVGVLLGLYAEMVGRPRWGLKTPYNEFYAEQIMASFPGAKMIHLIRDPRDVAASHRSVEFPYDVLKHIGEWRQSVDLAEQNCRLFKGDYVVVRYEELVAEPENVVRHVCDVIELPFFSEMMSMDNHPGWRGANSAFPDIGGWEFEEQAPERAITHQAVGRFSRELSPAHVWLYQRMLGNELERLGYDRVDVSLTAGDYWRLAGWQARRAKAKVRRMLQRA